MLRQRRTASFDQRSGSFLCYFPASGQLRVSRGEFREGEFSNAGAGHGTCLLQTGETGISQFRVSQGRNPRRRFLPCRSERTPVRLLQTGKEAIRPLRVSYPAKLITGSFGSAHGSTLTASSTIPSPSYCSKFSRQIFAVISTQDFSFSSSVFA